MQNGGGALIPLLFLETARISPQGVWHYQVEGFSGNIPHMFLINKLWDPILKLAFQTCFSNPWHSIHVSHAPRHAWARWVAKNRSDHTALWLVDITGYKTGVVGIGHQCGVWVEEKAKCSDSSTSFILQSTLKKTGRPITRFRGADPTHQSAGHQVRELVDLG